jgi:hypothetical protein
MVYTAESLSLVDMNQSIRLNGFRNFWRFFLGHLRTPGFEKMFGAYLLRASTQEV